MTAKVLGYARVSTAEQAEEGHSLAAQRERIVAYCRAHELELVEVIEDAGASAATLERPGLRRVMAGLASTRATTISTPHPRKSSAQHPPSITGIVVTRLDRLTRSLDDFRDLVRHHGLGQTWQLHAIGEHIDTSSATGELMLHLLLSVAQWERRRIGERISEVIQHRKRSEGRSYGRVPFGYRRTAGVLEPIAEQQAILAGIRTSRSHGDSLESIASHLNSAGVRGSRGGSWTATSVRRALNALAA